MPAQIRTFVDKLEIAELEALLRAASERKQRLLTEARASFLAEMRARAADLGVPLSQLAQTAGGRGGAKKAAGSRMRGGSRASPPVKYRGPNGETWSGRGRPARWLAALEAQGRRREEFAV
jgi:DNA-binding protein H-NS